MVRTRRTVPLALLGVLLLSLATAPVSAQKPKSQAKTASPPKAAISISTARVDEAFTGDLDAMVKRRIIRAAVAYNQTHYFIDKGVQRGMAYESLMLFENELNTNVKNPSDQVHVVFIPMSRDELIPSLINGKADVAAAQLTVTPDRQTLVAFSNPTMSNVNEIVVTGPGAPTIMTKADLAGQEVFVRKSSSYYDSLVALNGRLKAQGKREVILKPAPETLEDEDLMEMVNAGLVKIIVVDNTSARLWKKVLPHIVLHENVAPRTGGNLAVAMRKDNPKLLKAANTWIDKYGPRTSFGNQMIQRYTVNTKFVKNATSDAEMQRFQAIVGFFRKYGEEYGVDAVLMAAQGYQESGLNQNAKSSVGAIGVMQVMPKTGKELAVGDIRQVEANIHAGVKYIRYMMDTYYKDEPMDDLNKGLFAFAGYNAGPNRIKQLRIETKKRGLNPNLWFNNVERVVSEKIGRETVNYVANIYKYYVAYTLTLEQRDARLKAKGASN